ncbi:NXF1 factor, partial [Amia calva]|nr:NXF1 factor [Amia calva]
VDKDSCGSVNQFSRTFLTVPAVNAGLCVLSDNLYVWNPTMEKLRRAFVTARPMPPSSPLPTLTTEQQEMRSIFSLQSGMKLEWSQKCLQDNEWDFNKAAQIFTQFQVSLSLFLSLSLLQTLPLFLSNSHSVTHSLLLSLALSLSLSPSSPSGSREDPGRGLQVKSVVETAQTAMTSLQ